MWPDDGLLGPQLLAEWMSRYKKHGVEPPRQWGGLATVMSGKPRQARMGLRLLQSPFGRDTGLHRLWTTYPGDVNLVVTGSAPRSVSFCHQDEYLNHMLVVKGSKTWYVAPPESIDTTTMKKKSSVLRRAFDVKDDENQHLFTKINLFEGDLLRVPPMWWHQVESDSYTLAYSTFGSKP